MNPMMAGMNPAAVGGGPIAGAMMMNNVATPNNVDPNEGLKVMLNTHIYDYLLKMGFHDSARALLRDEKMQVNTTHNTKQSPGRQMNGIDDSMDTDGKDEPRYPDDLPRPKVPDSHLSTSFLFDWYCIFSEMFHAGRQKGKPGQMGAIPMYLQHAEKTQRSRDSQQNGQMLRNPQLMNQMSQFSNLRNMRNGAIPGEMQKTMMRNNMSQMHQMAQQNKMMQNVQRDQSDMDINGHRPQSPSSADNTGSPNKRPRLEGAQFNGQQMGPNGRGQGMPNPAANNANLQKMMMSGMPPQMAQAQFQQQFQNAHPAVREKSIQGAMPNGMPMNSGAMPNQGSPMMQPMSDGFMMDPNGFQPGMRQGMPQGAGGQGGNHALQDYQMQLMLLEQQNKKRLMMARQEQDSQGRADGQPGMPGQPGMQPPGMSPSGSRNGPSPNPNDQMKRTPQMGMPGSPTAGGPGGSPAPMNFNGQIPQNFDPMFGMKMGEGVMPAQGIRPPNGMTPNMPGARMPQGSWQGGPQGQAMMQQPSGGQPQNVGTPQQRSEMPPPQAPAVGANAGRGTQPSSPSAGSQAPPTPQQTNKANPTKGKKNKADNAKRPQKKGSAANASAGANASDSNDPPATPTPSTPITPVHPSSFKNAGGAANAQGGNAAGGPAGGAGAGANANAGAGGPAGAGAGGGQGGPGAGVGGPNGGAAGANGPGPNADPNAMAMAANGAFPDFSTVDQTFNLDFGPLDAPDVLENFDFDSFLNNPDDSNAGGVPFSFEAAGLGLEGAYGVDAGGDVQ